MVDPELALRLARLERQSLDQIRLELVRSADQIAKQSEAAESARRELNEVMEKRGQDIPFDLAHGLAQGLTTYRRQLEQRKHEQETQHQQALDAMQAQLLEVKRWELLANHGIRQKAETHRLEEQKALDEAALAARGRRLTGK